MNKVNTYLDDEEWRKARAAARLEHMSLSAFIRRATMLAAEAAEARKPS